MEKYTYIRKTITWDSRRYEVRGKTEQEACEKLADLVVSLKRGEFAASGPPVDDEASRVPSTGRRAEFCRSRGPSQSRASDCARRRRGRRQACRG